MAEQRKGGTEKEAPRGAAIPRGTDAASAEARPLGDDSREHGGRPEDVGDGSENESLETQRSREKK
jgi:hypothetical protein